MRGFFSFRPTGLHSGARLASVKSERRLAQHAIEAGCALLILAYAGIAQAKLPPPTPEQQAKTEAAKAKAAADAEAEKALLAKAQDRVAQRYIEEQKAKGVTVTPTQTAQATQEVPSAALNSRPTEKAGAYNEAVTKQSAPAALDGDQSKAGSVQQNASPVPAPAK